MTNRHYTSGCILSAVLAVLATSVVALDAAAQSVSFKEDVFPIIELRCLECHKPGGSGYEASGLDLRTYESIMKGTRHGSMVTPRRPLESNLMAVIEHRTRKEIQMPHNRKKLSKCELGMFRGWIAQGARNN